MEVNSELHRLLFKRVISAIRKPHRDAILQDALDGGYIEPILSGDYIDGYWNHTPKGISYILKYLEPEYDALDVTELPIIDSPLKWTTIAQGFIKETSLMYHGHWVSTDRVQMIHNKTSQLTFLCVAGENKYVFDPFLAWVITTYCATTPYNDEQTIFGRYDYNGFLKDLISGPTYNDNIISYLHYIDRVDIAFSDIKKITNNMPIGVSS